MPAEFIFEVTEAIEGGRDARALGYSIFTQGEDSADLMEVVRDAVTCHFGYVNKHYAVKMHLVEDKDITVYACTFRI
ncbi:MAG: hypothetical protein OXG26_18245 [Caldilineaceae bacterium]|nr:hypothetical protein [Caldilineaceae bacterium]